MKNTKVNNEANKQSSLINCKRVESKNPNDEYKAEYNRMFPTKMSSSNFLLLYTLFLLDKKGEPLYGKEILTEIQRTISANIWNPSHGTYYPLLDDMVKAGYIEIVKDTSSKKFYSITKLGKKELELRLAEFEPMLIKSFDFFSKIFSIMYNKKLDRPTTTNIEENKDNLDYNSTNQILETLSTINAKIK
jgi:DNA-binding PadR family transcriptional regulator